MENYEYEEDLDILYINNNFEREKIITNLTFGNLVIDIGESGKVLGVEIDCASKLFNFPSEQLKNLKLAEIRVVKVGNMLTLAIALATSIKEHTFQFAIQEGTKNIPIAC